MTEHTPVPWHVCDREANERAILIGGQNDTNGGHVAIAAVVIYPEAEANAEFIVRACNSHEELLEVDIDLAAYLEEMAPLMRQASVGTFSQREPLALRDRLKKAIAKAKGI